MQVSISLDRFERSKRKQPPNDYVVYHGLQCPFVNHGREHHQYRLRTVSIYRMQCTVLLDSVTALTVIGRTSFCAHMIFFDISQQYTLQNLGGSMEPPELSIIKTHLENEALRSMTRRRNSSSLEKQQSTLIQSSTSNSILQLSTQRPPSSTSTSSLMTTCYSQTISLY